MSEDKITIFGLQFEREPWSKREKIEFAILDKVYHSIDLLNKNVLDGGAGIGYSAKYLALHIGEGLVISVDIDSESFKTVRKIVNKNLEAKIVFINADLRNLNFIKDEYFDFVNLYFTLHTVESTTPGGLLQILKEAYRILKRKGKVIIVENYPSFKPIDKAQELLMELSTIEDEIMRVLSIRKDREYQPKELLNILIQTGFKDIIYEKISDGVMDPTLINWVSYLVRRAKEIRDKELKESILNRIYSKLKDVKTYGLRDSPLYVLYAVKK